MKKSFNAIKLIRSFGYMLASSGGSVLLSLAVILSLAYFLSAKEFGILMTAEAFVGLFSLFFEFGFKNSIFKIATEHEYSLEEWQAQEKDKADKKFQKGLNVAVGNALFIKALITIPLGILIYLAAKIMSYDSLTLHLIILYIFIFTFDNFAIVFGATRRFLGRFKLMAFITVSNPLLRFIAVIVVLKYLGGLVLLVQTFIGLSIFRLLLSFLTTIGFVQPKIDKRALKLMLAHSFKYGLFNFLNDLQTRIDRVMLEFFAGAANVAYYSVPARINRISRATAETVNKVFLPSLHKSYVSSTKEFIGLVKQLSRGTAIIGILTFFAVYYLTGPAIVKIYGDKYLDSLAIVEIFAFIGLTWLLERVPNLILATKGDHNRRLNAQAISTALNVALNLVLIPKFGISGAVYATLISSTTKLIIMIYFTLRYLELNRLVYMVTFAIALAIFLPLAYALIAFIAYLILSKSLTRSDIDAVLRTLKNRKK